MTSVLVSRFFLNLCEVYLSNGDKGTSQSSSQISSMCFAQSVIGNMGAPLNHGSSLSVKSQVPADLSPDRQMSSTKGLAVDEEPGEDDFDNSIEHPRFVKEPFKDGLELLDEDMGLHREQA
ncbi:hypothetical protein AcV5_000095 [Taiwanofungus camphoratus]|nr:hypothetical protein AcV5_000095 [Antrodia cinnamomea]